MDADTVDGVDGVDGVVERPYRKGFQVFAHVNGDVLDANPLEAAVDAITVIAVVRTDERSAVVRDVM